MIPEIFFRLIVILVLIIAPILRETDVKGFNKSLPPLLVAQMAR